MPRTLRGVRGLGTKKDANELLEATLADLNRRIARLETIGDFLGAEDLERLKRKYFIGARDAVTKWTRRALSEGLAS
jgi:hypothetical protein